MESKKINQLATNVAPQTSDLTIIGDPITGVSKKITLLQIANLFATTGTVTSVGITETGNALTITGSPITSAGTINIGFAGDATQYVRGDGALADFPTSTGGGSSVSYYLNSSVSQGTIGGVAYREFSKDPISGAGTDITASTNGYIASYITDANDPALLEVPAGNFNCEFYFSVNSNNHNPYVYAEVYKYDGTTFTLIGSSQSVPEYLTNGTTLSPYYFAIPVTQTTLAITDRIAIRIYVNVDTRVVTLHTENNHLCQVVTTFSKGLTSLNNLTRQVQFLATGTSGTDFNISSSTATHTFNLPVASATNTGKLSSTDWSTFNAKQPAGNYVTLDTTQTITGLKSFNTPVIFNNALNLTFGAPVTALGNSFAIYASKISNYSILSLYDADTAKYSQLNFDNTTNRTYTFPNASGTIALTSNLSSYVPYTGATANVTLGLFDLYAQNVFATDTSGNWLAALSRDTATAIGTLVLKSGGFTNYLQPITTVSSARTWTLPDASGTIALTSNINYPVTSVFGRTGAVVAASGDYTTTQVTEGTNLYFTDARARAALSFVAGSGAYNSTTGVITIPTNNNQITNGAGYITSSALSSYLPLAGGTLTGALNGTSAVFSSTVQASAYRLTGMTAGNGALYWSSDKVTLANYNATGLVVIEANGGTVTSTFGGATYNNDFVGTGRFTGALTGTSATFSGAIKVLTAANATNAINFGTSSTNYHTITYDDSTGKLTFNTDSSRIVSFLNSNVGIGTNSPSNKLTTIGSETGTQITTNPIGKFANTGNSFSKLVLGSDNANYDAVVSMDNNATLANCKLRFYIGNGTSSTAGHSNDQIVLQGNGNVGIGTSSPTAKLEIQDGHVRLYDPVSTAGAGYAVIWASNNGGTNTSFATIEGVTTSAGNRTGDIKFNTSNAGAPSEKMRITSGGYLKVSNNGTYAAPTGPYHEIVQTATDNSIGIAANTAASPYGLEIAFRGADPNNATNYMLGLYTTSPSFVWIYRIWSNGTVSARSDARWKKNIETTRDGYLEDLCKLRVVKYNWYNHEEDAPKELGLIAQEVEEVFPNLISYDKVTTKKQVEQEDGSFIEQEVEDGESRSVKTSVLPYMLLKGLQEAKDKIENLQAQIEELKELIKNK